LLKSFGDLAICHDYDHRKKLKNKGKLGMFLGVGKNHAAETFRFYDINKHSVFHSRSYKWTNQNFGNLVRRGNSPASNIQSSHLFTKHKEIVIDDDIIRLTDDDDSSDSESNDDEITNTESETGNIKETNCGRTRSGKKYQMDSYALLSRSTIPPKDFPDPITFNQAFNHKNPDLQLKWRDAISKELKDMNHRNVWTIIPRDNSKRIIKLKWIFKRKSDGRYRARLCAPGYLQIPGLDYHDIHAPVLHDVSLRILLIERILNYKCIRKLDIETAFLESNVESDIYIELPKGLEESVNYSESMGKLNKSIYGLAESARLFYKKLKGILIDKMGFFVSKSEPCLL